MKTCVLLLVLAMLTNCYMGDTLNTEDNLTQLLNISNKGASNTIRVHNTSMRSFFWKFLRKGWLFVESVL